MPRAAARPAPVARARAGAWWLAAMALLLALGSTCVRADSDAAVGEYRLKAAFLFKFLGFVEWPSTVFERPDAPFVIGVLGAKTLGDELGQTVAGRLVSGHPVQVRALGRGDAIAGLQVLFVGRAESGRVAAVVAAAGGQPLLVVTESDAGLAAGGGINFVVIDDKVRFDISLHPIEHAGLKVSARLLAVARNVLAAPS